MTARITLVLDVADLDVMVEFYVAALGYVRFGSVNQYASITPPPGEVGVKMIFQRVDEPRVAKNRLHIDIHATDIDAEADRLQGLGATRVRRVDELGFAWVVMADPEGNEFCVVPT